MPYDYIEEYQKQDDETIWEFRDKNAQAKIDTSLTETDYANPLTFETLQAQTAKNTKIKLEPIQDLHGYDKPWVGGAGKNLMHLTVDNIKATNTGGTWNGNVYTINNVTITLLTDLDNNIIGIKVNGTASSNVNFILSVYNKYLANGNYKLNGCPAGGSTSGTTYYLGFYIQGKSVYNFGNGDTNISIDGTEATGANVFIHAHANYNCQNLIFYPMIRLSTVSDSTFAPYTNICPISGHDQIDILGCGKNMLGCMEVASDTTGIAEFNGDEIKVVSVSNGSYKASNFIWDILPSQWGKRIYISCASATSSGSNDWRINLRTSSDGINYIERINITGALATKTMLIPEDTVKMMLLLYSTSAVSGNAGDYAIYKKLQLEFNEDGATEYELPQSSNDLSIDLPSTVYGGVLDLESGILTVTHNRIAITSDISISKNSDGWNAYHPSYYFFFSPSGIIDRSNITCISNIMVGVTRGQIQNTNLIYACSVSGGGNEIDFTSDLDNTTDVKQFLINNNAEFVYELATPTTIQLTPHQLSLLKAQNNLTTSQYTQIKVTYRNGIFATLEPATDLTDGLMSAMDKLKLDNIVPATTTTDGLMTATDKTKLDGVATSATKTESSTTNGNIKINGTETQVYDDSEIKGELTTDTSTIEGNPINFETLSAQTAKSTILSLEPIQDLHGYDKPWAGGVGKNILPMTVALIKALNTDGIWTGNSYVDNNVTFTIITDSDNNVVGIKVNGMPNARTLFVTALYFTDFLTNGVSYTINGNASGYSTDTAFLQVVKAPASGQYNIDDSYTFTYDSATQSNFKLCIRVDSGKQANNLIFYPMIRLSTETDPTFAPYTNICPITGRTEIGILGCGKNLCPYVESGAIDTGTGEEYPVTGVNRTGFIQIFPSTQYVLSGLGSGTIRIYEYRKDKSYISNYTTNARTFAVRTNDVNYVRIQSGDTILPLTGVQAEIGTQSTTYSPYTKSNDLTISFGQTVYGGQVDVEKGELVVDRSYISDLSTLTWSKRATTTNKWQFYVALNTMKLINSANDYADMKCSIYKIINANEAYNGNNGIGISSGLNNNYATLFVYDDTISELTDFQNAMDGVQLVYELATPITINLTPHAIKLLEGVNNISTDGDKITLTYRDGSVATLGDLTSAVDSLDSKIDESKILTDTATGDKYILVVTNGVLSVEQVSD